MTTPACVIALAGLPGVGKSTLARLLAHRLEAHVVSFGDYVRSLTVMEGRACDRATLISVGQQYVAQGAEEFVSDFLAWSSAASHNRLIADGVRHRLVHEALLRWARDRNVPYRLVHLSASPGLRAERRKMTLAQLMEIDAAPTEREAANELLRQADVRLAAGDLETMVASVLVSFGWPEEA